MLRKHIKNLFRFLKKREDFTWKFNFSEMRYYTMSEMIAKREDYKHPEQRYGLYLLDKVARHGGI